MIPDPNLHAHIALSIRFLMQELVATTLHNL